MTGADGALTDDAPTPRRSESQTLLIRCAAIQARSGRGPIRAKPLASKTLWRLPRRKLARGVVAQAGRRPANRRRGMRSRTVTAIVTAAAVED